MKRSEVREAVFFLTFEKLFGNGTAEDIIESAYEADNFEMNGDVESLFKSVDEKSEETDGIIAKFSESRQFSRIPKVSVAVLRIALYEMLYDDNVPDNVAISEAVVLTKKFAFEQDVQFVNGLLGAFYRSREKAEQ
ncbi:MAG: transcription antitermination factor NusB [Ruminococcus sp.]|nr:transcription antitermination factor NusB [Ruminococcus sp.]MCM1381738.1 transcription antitermination factor NusB [Muribaculaceae bacterium]MCM1479853.1 transcription antitermination factor NusB [Muribaculaceae bacterium]